MTVTPWPEKRLKYLAAVPIVNGVGEAGEFEDEAWPRYIRITDIADSRALHPDTFKSLPPAVARRAPVFRGDVLLAAVGATFGKGYLHTDDKCACYAGYLVRVRPRPNVDPRFLAYWTESQHYWDQVRSRMVQTTIQNFSAGKYRQLVAPNPPLPTQRTIADFLDRKTAAIDALIQKKERLIELLQEKRRALITQAVTKGLDPNVPMRDSGVDWIGHVPAHWHIRRLKTFVQFLNHRRVPLSGEERSGLEKVYPYYGASGIIDHVDRYLFDEDLILVAEDGANILARSSPLAFLARDKYWVNNHAHILRPRRGDLRFWVERLEAVSYVPFASGSAQPKLTKEALGDVMFAAPECAEQKRIGDFVDAVSAKLGPTLTALRTSLDRLGEYRQALISAAVTGKLDLSKAAA